MDGRAFEPHVRVPPGPKVRIAADVLVAHIQAADISHAAVDHDDFAVVAEIDLERVPPPPVAAERSDRHAGRRQVAFEGARAADAAAADLVVQEQHADAFPGLADQPRLQFPPQLIVANDEELDEDVFLGRVDPAEDLAESRLAVHQQLDEIAVRERHLGQDLEHAPGRRRRLSGTSLARGSAGWRPGRCGGWSESPARRAST